MERFRKLASSHTDGFEGLKAADMNVVSSLVRFRPGRLRQPDNAAMSAAFRPPVDTPVAFCVSGDWSCFHSCMIA